MDWIIPFYRRQNQWSGAYTGEVTAEHRQRVTAIERLARSGRKRVLELGAGGGQNAAAAAELGHEVVAVEIVPEFVAHIQALAKQVRPGSLTAVQGNFYQVDLAGPFDVVCYWDGFGVGTDEDQRRLLRRVAGWLAPIGCGLIDINTPWYWTQAAGREMRFGNAQRRYDFDADDCRMLDRWWPGDDEAQAITQSLRCYSPADLRLLLEGTGLHLDLVEPGGAVDYEHGRYFERVPLEQAMQYLARIVFASE